MISGMFDVAHGADLPQIWGSCQILRRLPRFGRSLRQMYGMSSTPAIAEVALEGMARTEDFFKSIGMPVSLKDLGLS